MYKSSLARFVAVYFMAGCSFTAAIGNEKFYVHVEDDVNMMNMK